MPKNKKWKFFFKKKLKLKYGIEKIINISHSLSGAIVSTRINTFFKKRVPAGFNRYSSKNWYFLVSNKTSLNKKRVTSPFLLFFKNENENELILVFIYNCWREEREKILDEWDLPKLFRSFFLLL